MLCTFRIVTQNWLVSSKIPWVGIQKQLWLQPCPPPITTTKKHYQLSGTQIVQNQSRTNPRSTKTLRTLSWSNTNQRLTNLRLCWCKCRCQVLRLGRWQLLWIKCRVSLSRTMWLKPLKKMLIRSWLNLKVKAEKSRSEPKKKKPRKSWSKSSKRRSVCVRSKGLKPKKPRCTKKKKWYSQSLNRSNNCCRRNSKRRKHLRPWCKSLIIS